ncbi:glycoside hydrolase family 26 protein [Actinocorallia longicatena]|uniref:GH26 domain-containing protein n=1 Tax=Actinocorallia longicatena TaxID=111803 RepID=A0ABP6QK93_9ACTN
MSRRLTGALCALAMIFSLAACGDPALNKKERQQAELPDITLPKVDLRPLLSPKVGGQDREYLGVSYEGSPQEGLEKRNALGEKSGKQPNLVKYFQEWGGDFDIKGAKAIHDAGALPFVDTEPLQEDLDEIIAGKWDYMIRAYAGQVRDSGIPIAYSFGHEFNGWWYRWGYCSKSKGLTGKTGDAIGIACRGDSLKNTPKQYADAWKHVHDEFEKVGATNVIWVWSPNAAKAPDQPALKEFYPGDGYVDWIGVSGYMRFGGKQADATPIDDILLGPGGTFHDLTKELNGFAPTKPILIAETGSDAVKRKPADIKTLFATVLKNHNFIGFVWFDVKKTEDAGNTVNYLINTSPAATAAWNKYAAFQKMGGDPRDLRYDAKAAANGN